MKNEETPIIINGTVCNDLGDYLNSSVCEVIFDDLKDVLEHEDLDCSTNISDYADLVDWDEEKVCEFYDYAPEALVEKLDNMDAKETVNEDTVTFNEAYYSSSSESYKGYHLTLPISWEEIGKEFDNSKEKNNTKDKAKDDIER